MSKTIDQELLPYLESRLKELQYENFPLAYVYTEMYGAIHDWLVEQQLDPETFNEKVRSDLVFTAMSNLHMTLT